MPCQLCRGPVEEGSCVRNRRPDYLITCASKILKCCFSAGRPVHWLSRSSLGAAGMRSFSSWTGRRTRHTTPPSHRVGCGDGGTLAVLNHPKGFGKTEQRVAAGCGGDGFRGERGTCPGCAGPAGFILHPPSERAAGESVSQASEPAQAYPCDDKLESLDPKPSTLQPKS